MKYALSISAALLLALCQWQPASAQPSQRPAPVHNLVTDAVNALGGADALRNLKAITITGEAKYWEPGQSKVAGKDPKHVEDVKFTVTRDLTGGRARTQWDRDHKYPDPALIIKYTETVLPNGGFITDDKGANSAMASMRMAAAQRELNRASPTLLLKAMENPKDVRPIGNQRIGRQSYRAVSFNDGSASYIILFDATTKLPAAIRTLDDDSVRGDQPFDAVLGDWKAVGGVQVAHALSYQIGGVEVGKVTYTQVTANPTVAADTFAVPDTVRAALKGAATSNVPYQWIIRRLYMSRYMDTEQPYLPAGGSVKLVELAPNVQHAQGASGNNLIVAMKDHLIVFDAPYGEALSRTVIDLAKAKYPGKPIKYLVQTHHHMDHSGGLRAYVAEGATILVAAPTRAYFNSALRNPRTVAGDAQQTARKPIRITEVKDQTTLKDDAGGEIRIYNIKNPHAEGYLLGHVVKDNIVFVTDLISPRGPVARTEGTLAVGEALKKHGITNALIAGGHGTTAKQSEIGAALGVEVSSR
jgi:glyoxylase-like metal-dependent hydrolase (beta-lactamase superfamily II)